jgi:UDP-glucose-4-epimerase GalE
VYGIPEQIPITEQMPREPVNPYGASKLFFENALEAYSRAYGLRSVSLRYFNAAGADESGEIGEIHDPETHLIPLALGASVENGPELQIYGSDYPTPDGTCVRDYIHVSDLADAHVRALQHLEVQQNETQHLERDGDEKGGESLAINLGTGRGHSVLEVIRAVESATGRPVRRKIVPRRPGDPPILVADPAKAHRVLGWTAQRNLADIVSSAWIWMQKESKGEEAVATAFT